MTNGLEKGSKEIIEAKENEIQKLSERVKALESEVEMLKKDKAALEKKRDELEKNIKERPAAAVNNKVDTTDATTSHAASKRKYLHKFCKKSKKI
jgi:predicted transcriptional regulator